MEAIFTSTCPQLDGIHKYFHFFPIGEEGDGWWEAEQDNADGSCITINPGQPQHLPSTIRCDYS